MVALGNIMYVNIVHVYYFAATVCNSFRILSCPLHRCKLQQQQAAGNLSFTPFTFQMPIINFQYHIITYIKLKKLKSFLPINNIV